jgi:hypothetical protein
MSTARRSVVAALTAGVAATAILLSSLSTTSGADPAASRGSAPTDTIAAVRRATAKYHDPAVALADGFIPTSECAAHPQLGGMGVHYINPARIGDPSIVATEPEVLLYEPTADGGVRLVGVEWMSIDPDGDVATDAGRPSVLGQAFDGPMPGHDANMPVHFDLHAWIWKHNPSGTFSPWNPAVRCQ